MLIVDAQVHIWNSGQASPHHQTWRRNPFAAVDLLQEMAEAGVDCAVLAPPAWEPNGNQTSLTAAQLFPDEFVVSGYLNFQIPANPAMIENWCEPEGMNALRLIFNRPERQKYLLDGSVEWIWQAAEKANVPIMLLIPGAVSIVGNIARKYPNLRLCVDHLGIPRGAKDAAAFEHFPELLALARFPNISVKAGGSPAYSTVDEWPHPSLHGYLRQVYDAFGPERIFWASDLSRMRCSYKEVIAMYTKGIPWLTADDKRLIMGEAVCQWLNWWPSNYIKDSDKKERLVKY